MWDRLFPSLRQRDFRLLCTTIALGGVGRWMETVVISWVVLERTNSAFLVGLVAAARFSGSLLGPVGGLLVDRFDRRRLLILSQGAHLVQTAGLLSLLLLDQLSAGAAAGIVLFASLFTMAVDFPARYALLADVVDRDSLSNAVALTRMAQDFTAILGPLLGGTLTVVLSPAGVLALTLPLQALALASIVLVHSHPITVKRGAAWSNLIAGLSYLRNSQLAGPIVVLALLANTLGFPFLHSLLPVYTRDVLGGGPAQLGVLMASAGAGALLGSLGIAMAGGRGANGSLMMAGFLSWAGLLVLIAVTRWYEISVPLLFLAWMGQSLALNVSTSLLLLVVEPEMRGRVLGVRGLMVGSLPLGSLMLGAGADLWGASFALALSSLAFLLSVFAVGVARPQLWRRVEFGIALGQAPEATGPSRP